MGALRSLRGRVALLATLAVGVVLLLVGATAVASFAERERERVDESLAERPVGALVRALRPPGHDGPRGHDGPPGDGGPPGENGPPGGPLQNRVPLPGPDGGPPPDLGPRALRPEGEYIRVFVANGDVARSVDAPDNLPAPADPGVSTLDAGGQDYRSLTREIPGGGLLEVGTTLEPSQERVASLRNRLLLLGLVGLVLVAGLSWWLAGLALRPLRALRDAAGRVTTTRDLSTRLPDEGAPGEVAELTERLNAMLARLEASAAQTDEALEATRRFAGDAGHELRTPMTSLRANLGALRRNPGMSADDRRATLEQAEREAERATRLLELLQTLARGDAGAALPREQLDLSAVAEAAVEASRARHPDIEWTLDAPPEDLELAGWPDGLRALVDNLLENAARHGRPGGRVLVALERSEERLLLTVDDDGPGVAPEGRERAFERFSRGEAALHSGSGLGLALVRQQARLHGGDATVEESPLGGARFRVDLVAGSPNAHRREASAASSTPRSA